MPKIYSPSTNTFFDPALKEAYDASGTWPSDGVEVDDPVFEQFAMAPAPEGKVRAAGPDGLPVWVDAPLQSVQVTKVSRFQALAALMQAGLLDDVTAWANAPTTDPLHKLAFDTAAEFSRSSPTLAAGAAALGWSEGQLDDLFAAAAQIQA